jgi:hypothetical protein
MNAWDKLPNAKHIDWVLAHSMANPKLWGAYPIIGNSLSIHIAKKDLVWSGDRLDILESARAQAFLNKIRIKESLKKESDAFTYLAYEMVCITLTGLVAFDEVDYVLNADPKAVELYVRLGVPQAILLQTMNMILHQESNQTALP